MFQAVPQGRGQQSLGGFRFVRPEEIDNSFSGKAKKYLRYYLLDPKQQTLMMRVGLFVGSIVLIRKYGHYLEIPMPDPAVLNQQAQQQMAGTY